MDRGLRRPNARGARRIRAMRARADTTPTAAVRGFHRGGACGSSRRALRITPPCSTSMAHGWRRGLVHTSERPRSITFTAAVRQPVRVFRPGFDRHHALHSPDARRATPTSCGNVVSAFLLCPNSTLWRLVASTRNEKNTSIVTLRATVWLRTAARRRPTARAVS
jgi:hypothetical protein